MKYEYDVHAAIGRPDPRDQEIARLKAELEALRLRQAVVTMDYLVVYQDKKGKTVIGSTHMDTPNVFLIFHDGVLVSAEVLSDK